MTSDPNSFPIVWDGAGVIPGGGLVRVTGLSADRATVAAPDRDGMGFLAVVGPMSVPDLAPGYGAASVGKLVQLAYDPESGRPKRGDRLGARAGSFFAHVGGPGFRALADGANGWVAALRDDAPAGPWKDSVRARTTAALASLTYGNGARGAYATLTATANGALAAQDGVTLVADDDLLVANQAAPEQNGIYVVTQLGTASLPFILTRRQDADTAAELLGAAVAVREGTAFADTVWLCTANGAITVGTTGLPWAQVGGAGAVSAWKGPVRVATTTAGTLASSFESGDTIDGVVITAGDRVLIKNQAAGSENGIYTVNVSGAPTRAADADTGAELLGATVAVTSGTANADTVWLCTTEPPITVGSSVVSWRDVSGNVYGPAASIEGRFAEYDGTSGKLLQQSPVGYDPTRGMYGTGAISFGAWTTSMYIGVYNFGGSDVFGVWSGAAIGAPDAGLYATNVYGADSVQQTTTVGYISAAGVYRSAGGLGGAPLDGINGTCTVKVGGVDKTLTVRGGIVTSIA